MTRSKASIAQALLDKTVERGCTPGEQRLATEKARELIQQYGLREADFTWPGQKPKPEPKAGSFDDIMRWAAQQAWAKEAKARQEARQRERAEHPRFDTIQELAYYLLRKVVRERFGVRYGYTWEDMIDAVHRQFPDARTGINSMRWYATQMRKAGDDLPVHEHRK